MTRLERFLALALLVCLVLLSVAGVVGWRWFQERRAMEGLLSAADADFQRASSALATAQAQLVTSSAVNASYDAAVKRGALPDARPAAKAAGAVPAAVLTATGTLKPAPGTGLVEPLDFRVTAAILKQTAGPLQTAQLSVQALDAAGHVVETAELHDVKLVYAPPAPTPLWDPHAIAEIGLTLPGRLPLSPSWSFGLGAQLLQWQGFGVQVTGFTDFRSLEGSGAAVAALWRPSLAGRPLNFAVALGPAVTLTGAFGARLAGTFTVW